MEDHVKIAVHMLDGTTRIMWLPFKGVISLVITGNLSHYDVPLYAEYINTSSRGFLHYREKE